MFLKVFLKDGKTDSFDIAREEDRASASLSDSVYQSHIRGLAIQNNGTMYTVTTPSRFDSISYMFEAVRKGDKLVSLSAGYIADEIIGRLTVYLGNPSMVKMDVKRVGKPRWVPPGMAMPQRHKDG